MLHGIDTIRKQTKLNLEDTETSIVCVIGTAPTFLLGEDNKTLNEPIPIRCYEDIAKYAGKNIDEYTLPDALETVLTESKGANIYMINVFDELRHKSTVEDKAYTLSAGKCQLEHNYINNLTVKYNNSVGVENVDYELEEGNVIKLNPNAFNNASCSALLLSYDYPDPTLVLASDVVGTIDNAGKRTGIKAIYNIQSMFGVLPNILIAPDYSSDKAVATELTLAAEDIKARTYLDCPDNVSINKAISARNVAENNIDLRNTSENAMYIYPYVKRYNSNTNTYSYKAPSPVAAGIRVLLNKKRNVAKSISNTVCTTVQGLKVPVQFILNKENTESNALNSAGITTFINYKGEYRIFGARNCSYPSKSGIETFDSIIDTANFIEKTIEESSFNCVDESITRSFIDDILEKIRAKFNSWKNSENQIILNGNVWYDESNNPAEQVANGKIIFNYDFCPPPVAEHIRYQSFINIKIITNALSAE